MPSLYVHLVAYIHMPINNLFFLLHFKDVFGVEPVYVSLVFSFLLFFVFSDWDTRFSYVYLRQVVYYIIIVFLLLLLLLQLLLLLFLLLLILILNFRYFSLNPLKFIRFSCCLTLVC